MNPLTKAATTSGQDRGSDSAGDGARLGARSPDVRADDGRVQPDTDAHFGKNPSAGAVNG
jgi:hypothetical protein